MVFKMRTLSLPRTEEDLLVIRGSSLTRFTLRELKLATNNFTDKNFVGRGGFGLVYRGQLADGSLVAIKRCSNITVPHHELEFQTEVEIGASIASVHRNVLRLLGYCMTRTERLLVYPFSANRSVHSWLHDRLQSDLPLDWPTRKRIALGVAKGLAHFHYGSSFTIIHLDVKPANILLDDQFEAVLCDFGLSKFVGKNEQESNSNWVQRPMEELDDEDPFKEDEDCHESNCFSKSCWNFTRTSMVKPQDGEESRECTKWLSECTETAQASYHESNTHVTTAQVCGTFGYLDPDYFRTSQCSVKTDVFGYGVTLLQLVTGQRPIYRLSNGGGYTDLHTKAKRLFGEDKLDMLVDSDLKGVFDHIKEEMKQLIQLALLCTEEYPWERPVMTDVIKIIENLGKPSLAVQLLGAENDLSNCESNQEIELAHQLQPAEMIVANCIECEPSEEIKQAQPQPEKVLVPKVVEGEIINNNQQHDFQLNINSGGIFFSFNFTNLSVLSLILFASLCINIVSIWPLANPRY